MLVKSIFPLLAGAVAITVAATAVSAGENNGRWSTQGERPVWQQNDTSNNVTRRASGRAERFETRRQRKARRRAEWKSERWTKRKARRQQKTAIVGAAPITGGQAAPVTNWTAAPITDRHAGAWAGPRPITPGATVDDLVIDSDMGSIYDLFN